MARRILIAEMKQETSTFNPQLTVYEDFHQLHGGDLLSTRAGTQTEIAGALEVFGSAETEIEPVGGMAAWAVSGGPIREPDLQRLLEEFSAAVAANGDVEGVLFCLHGAMAGEETGDPEGQLLVMARDLLAPNVPIVVSLDLHAVFTLGIKLNATLVVPFHTYPHVDQYETGQRAARLLLGILDREITSLTSSCLPLPMLVRGDELLTETGLFGKAIRVCQEIEASEGGLSAGVFIGNPFTDVEELKTWVMVCTDGDQDLARAKAQQIGQFLWEHRERLVAELVSLEEAISTANTTDGLAVFSDAADATASGASGDSNAILAGLLGHDPDVTTRFSGRALLSCVDQPAAALACRSGAGATIETTLGGTRDPGRFDPLAVSASVLSVHDGRFTYEGGKQETGGETAVLRIEAEDAVVDVLVTERSVYVVGRNVYTAHGLDPVDYDVVVVKSPNGFRTHYEEIAAAIVPVDVPGSTSANLRSLPFENCDRPIFPLDDDVPAPPWAAIAARNAPP